MTSFLDMEPKQRKMYVARMLGLNPNAPESWPDDIIDRIISKAEHRADMTVQEECRRLHNR